MWAKTDWNGAGPEYQLKFEPQLANLEPQNIIEQVKAVLPQVPKARMEELTTAIRKCYLAKYKRRRQPKYGSISKCPTPQELQVFMKAVDSPKLALLFEWQYTLALRIGEVSCIRIPQIDLNSRELVLKSLKTNRLDTLLIPIPLFKKTIDFITANAKAIEESGGYLFFADKSKSHGKNTAGHLEQNYIRNRFRKYLTKCNLDVAYDVSEEQTGRKPRRLLKFSTHSLRHFGITRFAHACNGNVLLASKFARHVSPETTSIYLSVQKKEVYDVVDSIALDEVNQLKKRLSS